MNTKLNVVISRILIPFYIMGLMLTNSVQAFAITTSSYKSNIAVSTLDSKVIAIKTVSDALLKLPADKVSADKITSKVTLQASLDAVNKAIVTAMQKKVTDVEIQDIKNYGRIEIAEKRMGVLNAEAAAVVDILIQSLPDFEALKATDEKKVNVVNAAYEKLTQAQKDLVRQENVTKLKDEVAAIPRLKDAVSAEAVDKLIESLPSIEELKATDRTKINSVVAAYDKLTQAQKALVKEVNVEKLTRVKDAMVAMAVGKLVEALPTLQSLKATDGTKVNVAKAAYDNLTQAQKDFVKGVNVEKLTSSYDAVAAMIVDKLIEALPTLQGLKATDEKKVNVAKSAYEVLTERQKFLVKTANAKKLNDEFATIPRLIEEMVSAAAVTEVDKLIQSLPSLQGLKATDEKKVNEAKAAYEALTENQKNLLKIENVKKLNDEVARMPVLIKAVEDALVIKTLMDALLKLPASKAVADKTTSSEILKGLLGKVNVAIADASSRGISDAIIQRVPNYGRILIAQNRIESITKGVDVSSLLELTAALDTLNVEKININSEITIPVGKNIIVKSGQTLILNSKLTVIGGVEVNGSIETTSEPSTMARMALTESMVNNSKLEVIGTGKISVKAGSLEFDSFSDIITPSQDSVILYAGAMVKIGDKQYIGNEACGAVIELSNFDGSSKPVAGYFLNGDGKLLLVIFEKAEILQDIDNALDISILVKAGKVNSPAGKLIIPDFNIIKAATEGNSSRGTIVIEANGNLIVNNKTVVSANDPMSVFNATGGEIDNRRGIGFFKSQNNSILAGIHGDVTMNESFNTAIIKPEYFGYNDFHKTDLEPTLDIKFDPVVADFIGVYWGNSIPVKGKYQMIDNQWVKMSDLTAYNVALSAVIKSKYTAESWAAYQVIVAENLVTVANTQAKVDEATSAIITAQSNLVTVPPAVISVTVSLVTATMGRGTTKQLTAKVDVVGGATQTVIWESSDPKVAVSTTGLVTVAADAAEGGYTITATSIFDGSKTATSTITVIGTVKVLDATVKANTFGSIVKITLTPVGVKSFSTATKYQVLTNTTAISAITKLGTETIVFPAKVLGDKVNVKLFDADTKEVKIIEVLLGESGIISYVTTATVKAATLGSSVTVTSNAIGAVNYQILDGIKPISAVVRLGTTTTVFPAKVAGDKVSVKLTDAVGAQILASEVVLVETKATVKPATFGALVTVTSSQSGAVNFQIFDGIKPISAVAKIGATTTIFPVKVAGDKVSVKLIDTSGAVIATIEVVLTTAQ